MENKNPATYMVQLLNQVDFTFELRDIKSLDIAYRQFFLLTLAETQPLADERQQSLNKDGPRLTYQEAFD